MCHRSDHAIRMHRSKIPPLTPILISAHHIAHDRPSLQHILPSCHQNNLPVHSHLQQRSPKKALRKTPLHSLGPPVIRLPGVSTRDKVSHQHMQDVDATVLGLPSALADRRDAILPYFCDYEEGLGQRELSVQQCRVGKGKRNKRPGL